MRVYLRQLILVSDEEEDRREDMALSAAENEEGDGTGDAGRKSAADEVSAAEDDEVASQSDTAASHVLIHAL